MQVNLIRASADGDPVLALSLRPDEIGTLLVGVAFLSVEFEPLPLPGSPVPDPGWPYSVVGLHCVHRPEENLTLPGQLLSYERLDDAVISAGTCAESAHVLIGITFEALVHLRGRRGLLALAPMPVRPPGSSPSCGPPSVMHVYARATRAQIDTDALPVKARVMYRWIERRAERARPARERVN